ncbi:hypothetical protein BDF19DRAFT_468512 [Syncephalis fuscata]|nr:hypothetical protein BDF19DRAFT_468512 [Syncephalis fuscata]
MKTQKITKLDWVGGNISINVAKVEWNGQPGFLKCMAEAANFIYEAKTFKVLEKADSLLKDAAKVYAPYIQHPLYSFKVPKTIEPHNTLCFIYTLANGVGSDVFLQKKSWEDKAIFLPQIMMQSIQGLMYLRYANLVHNDIIHDNILVEQIGGSKTIKATVVDYDLTRLIVDEKKSILETNNLTPLDKLNPLFASMLCRTENVKFVEKMYTSITGTPPPFEDKLRPGAYKALENIFRAIFDPLPGKHLTI